MSQPPGPGGPSAPWPPNQGPGGHFTGSGIPGGDPGTTQLYPAGPGGPPSEGPGPLGPQRQPRNRKKIALIVTASVLALALIVVGALLFRNYQQQVAAERAAEEARLAEEARRAEAVTAGAVAEDFLQALSESDAEQALSLAAAPPEGNNDLLSRDVLFEANKRAPLTGVAVEETTLTEESPGVWDTAAATVRYSIGDAPQTVDLPLRKVAGTWKIDDVAAEVDLGLNGPERLVNGVTVPPGSYNLFPGSYSVTSANPLIGLDRTEFVLASPVDPEVAWDPQPILSEEGRNQSIEAGKRLINDCLQVRDLAPEGCPFIRWREDGLAIDKSTLRYTLKNDPFANVEFGFNGATMTASTTVDVSHEIRASATRNGQRGTLVPQTQTNPAGITVKLGTGQPEASFT